MTLQCFPCVDSFLAVFAVVRERVRVVLALNVVHNIDNCTVNKRIADTTRWNPCFIPCHVFVEIRWLGQGLVPKGQGTGVHEDLKWYRKLNIPDLYT